MPNVTFALPHWIYWLGLLFVPLIAMYVVRKQRGKKVDGELSNPIAYMLWLAGGFVGLHRFYVKNAWGFIYIPVFIALLLANVQVKNAMDRVSAAKNNLTIAEFVASQPEAFKIGSSGGGAPGSSAAGGSDTRTTAQKIASGLTKRQAG